MLPIVKQADAINWFVGKARSVQGYRRNIVERTDRARGHAVIGKMFFFWYDPKHKRTLPIYDRFPLVFPIERYGDGFLGLNIHYLPGPARTALLERLSHYSNTTKYTETTKLRLSYDLLKSTTMLDLAKPCVKRYLSSHVRSPFVEVTAPEWSMAAALPVELFVVKGKQ